MDHDVLTPGLTRRLSLCVNNGVSKTPRSRTRTGLTPETFRRRFHNRSRPQSRPPSRPLLRRKFEGTDSPPDSRNTRQCGSRGQRTTDLRLPTGIRRGSTVTEVVSGTHSRRGSYGSSRDLQETKVTLVGTPVRNRGMS